jgi:hypothetical protein
MSRSMVLRLKETRIAQVSAVDSLCGKEENEPGVSVVMVRTVGATRVGSLCRSKELFATRASRSHTEL